MDSKDADIVAALRVNARISISELAATLGLSRTTLRARIERLERRGVILGYSAILSQDVRQSPVRAIMCLRIEGQGTRRIVHRLRGIDATTSIHSTNGKWDLIVELGAETLEALDWVLAEIRMIDGVTSSETSLLLTTHHSPVQRPL